MKQSAFGSAGKGSYVIATAAYNEEKFIEKLIVSVVEQTHQPLRWIVVSDGSTDGTDEIVNKYSERYPFIQLCRISDEHPRNFSAQVHAINAGLNQLRDCDCEFIGNLDADVTLEPTYFARLLEVFDRDPRLGLAGGYIYEETETGKFQSRLGNSPHSVAHAVQLFRRECLLEIGGAYTPLPYGGPDWYAEVRARMQNWKVEAVPELPVYHHRPTGGAEGLWRCCYRMGLMDYSLGAHPLFEAFKMARRMRVNVKSLSRWRNAVGVIVRSWAFIWAHFRRESRSASPEMVRFLRREEMARLRKFLFSGSKTSSKQKFDQRGNEAR